MCWNYNHPVKLEFYLKHMNFELDAIILFRTLEAADLKKIVDIELARIQKILESKRIHLEVDESARSLLAEEGWDPVFGARPLKRAVRRLVQDPLSSGILKEEFQAGDRIKAKANPKGNGLLFETIAGEGK